MWPRWLSLYRQCSCYDWLNIIQIKRMRYINQCLRWSWSYGGKKMFNSCTLSNYSALCLTSQPLVLQTAPQPPAPDLVLGISHSVPKASDSALAKPHTPIHSRQPLSLCLGWELGGNPTDRRWREGWRIDRGRWMEGKTSAEWFGRGGICRFWYGRDVGRAALSSFLLPTLFVLFLLWEQVLSSITYFWEFRGCVMMVPAWESVDLNALWKSA